MEDFVYYNALYDIYGCLLTEKEQQSFEDYYQEDLSLAEIASEKQISRSAVQKMIKNVLDKLNYYESKLHIYDKEQSLRKIEEMDNVEAIKKVVFEMLK